VCGRIGRCGRFYRTGTTVTRTASDRLGQPTRAHRDAYTSDAHNPRGEAGAFTGQRRRLEVVASGEAYETKAGAHKGCEAVQRAAADATIVDVDS